MRYTSIYPSEAAQILDAIKPEEQKISLHILDNLRKVACDVSHVLYGDYGAQTTIVLQQASVEDANAPFERPQDNQNAIEVYVGDGDGQRPGDTSCYLSIDNAKELVKALQMMIASAENNYEAYRQYGGELSEEHWQRRTHGKKFGNTPF